MERSMMAEERSDCPRSSRPVAMPMRTRRPLKMQRRWLGIWLGMLLKKRRPWLMALLSPPPPPAVVPVLGGGSVLAPDSAVDTAREKSRKAEPDLRSNGDDAVQRRATADADGCQPPGSPLLPGLEQRGQELLSPSARNKQGRMAKQEEEAGAHRPSARGWRSPPTRRAPACCAATGWA